MKRSWLFLPSRWRLTPKLLMAFLLAAVLPVTAASVFSLNYFYGVAFDNVRTTLVKELGTARLFMDEWSRRLESDTRLASRENVVSLNLALGLTAPVLDYLETLRGDRRLAMADLLDSEGHLVDRTGSDTGVMHPLLTNERLLEARAQNGASFTVTREDGRILFLSLVPVNDDSGQASNFLLTGVDPGSGETEGILDTIRQVVSGPVVFGGTNGFLGSAPGTPLWDEVHWPKAPVAGTLVPAVSSGTTYLFGFVGVGGSSSPAWVGVSFSLEGFQRVANAAAGGLILIAVLCVSLSCVAAIAFSRGLTRPLLTMARQAGAWTEGQGGKRLDVTTQDESGILGRAFNEALDRLDVTLDSLRKTQNYLKNIFNSLTSVLVSIDETGTIQEWNVAAERFNGTKAADALGRKVWDLSPVFDGLLPLLELAIATREPQFIKKDLGNGHEKRSFDLCLYPLVWNGVSGVVIRMDDITDSLKKDRQLLQAQKMETIGTLTEGIAHNFNNLLTGITGTVSVLGLELRDGVQIDRDKMRLRMAMIEDAARKASEIVRRLMTLTHGGAGEFSTVDLSSVVREVTRTSRMVLDHSVEVEFRLGPTTAMVYGDRSQLEQCLLNLIINASHAMTFMRPRGEHSGGTVRVTLETITAVNEFLASHPEAVRSDYWLLQVRDDGVGISAENLPKIFDPFFTTKEMDKGSGLGMAMVYASVRQHNGFIDLYSEVGRGTTVNLYLPILHQPVSSPPVSAARGPAILYPGHGLILVVDDEMVVQSTAQMILQACGYEVITAGNGIEALGVYQARSKEIRAVLLDSSMPKLSGAETLEALRQLNPAVKVVMSSGLFDSKRNQTADNLQYLAKPYSLAELSRALSDLLGKTS